MTLPSWLHDLSGSAEMPSWPKFALFGLPSGLPIQKQFSTQCESNLWCKKNTSAWNRSRKKPSIRRKILRDRFLKMDRDYWKIINTDTLMIQNIKFTISTFFQSLRLWYRVTLRIDFVTYSPKHFINDANDVPLRHNRDLH